MKIEVRNWDVTEYLGTEDDIAAYIDAVLEDGDPALIVKAIGDVARARGMTEIAKSADLSRESLYRALTDRSHPEFATIMKVLRAFGLRITVARLQVERKPAADEEEAVVRKVKKQVRRRRSVAKPRARVAA